MRTDWLRSTALSIRLLAQGPPASKAHQRPTTRRRAFRAPERELCYGKLVPSAARPPAYAGMNITVSCTWHRRERCTIPTIT